MNKIRGSPWLHRNAASSFEWVFRFPSDPAELSLTTILCVTSAVQDSTEDDAEDATNLFPITKTRQHSLRLIRGPLTTYVMLLISSDIICELRDEVLPLVDSFQLVLISSFHSLHYCFFCLGTNTAFNAT